MKIMLELDDAPTYISWDPSKDRDDVAGGPSPLRFVGSAFGEESSLALKL